MRLIDFDTSAFLRETWQREPRLIRNAFGTWHNPLEPDELAGLACEPGIESRLVLRNGGDWQVELGPLQEARFGELGDNPWTLLVQAVDHQVPQVAALIEPFRFIPNWRVDDVMVSYAVDQGGVGPHFDRYDVFLVQGLGTRRWQIGPRCDEGTPLLPHPDLRLLERFEPAEEWLLGPGDVLYVPPGLAHDGVAVGDDCMTYSVGFRAPSRAELIEGWAAHRASTLDEDDRYRDAFCDVQANPGEIAPDALERLLAMVAESLLDRDAFAAWFGTYSTAPKYPEIDWRPDAAPDPAPLRAALAQGSALLRNAASRFSFVRDGAGSLTLFVDGRGYPAAGAAAQFAEQLCAAPRLCVAQDTLASESIALIGELIEAGSVALDRDG